MTTDETSYISSHNNNNINNNNIQNNKNMKNNNIKEDSNAAEEPDIELLTRKVAKCDRLLKNNKKGTLGKESISKLKKKRAEYVLQLGELAYQAALLASTSTGTSSSTTTTTTTTRRMAGANAPDPEISPTTVTKQLEYDSSYQQQQEEYPQFNDSLAVFDQSVTVFEDAETLEHEVEEVEVEEDVVLLLDEEAAEAVLETEDEEDDEAEEDGQELKPITTTSTTEQLLQILPVDDDDDDDDDAASEVNRDQQDEFLPQAGGEHFSTSSSERRKTPSTTKDDQKSSAEEVKVNDVEVLANERTKGDLGLLPLAVVEDDEKPTEDEDTEISDDYEEEDENSEASEKLSTMAAPLEEPNKDHDTGSNDDESTTSKYDDDDDDDDHDPQASDAVLLDLQDDNPTSSAAGEQAPTKIDERVPPAPPSSNLSTSMGSPTTTISSHSTKIDLDDDGEGSVSKLRAMFDSPTVDGEKPRRSWRPKKTTGVQQQMPSIPSDDDDATGEVLLEETSLQNETKKKKKTEEEENPHPTVTMKVQQGTGASRQSSVVTLHQAVMTSSVQDIEGRLVALVSLFPESMYEYLPKQNRALLIFQALGLVESIIYVDGSNPAERDRRNELFELSGKRGSYPQLFVRNDHTGQLEFFADFDKIELLNDCQTLKEEIEKAITIRR